ncbi:MAG TPA: hypothetical protein VFC63_17375 [Blastocatellia bacterium]|nr:hypothetical protein [Blastocatellia bacterium]
MSSRVSTPFYMEMQNEETVGGRLAKLPFGIMLMILLTGAMSYYFEHKQPAQDAVKTTEAAIQQTIAQHQSGKSPAKVPVSNSRWYLFGSAALLVPGAAGLVTLTVIRRRKNFNRQRRSRA